MIETDGIVKRFGRVVAVDRVSFAVPSGSVCGFLGPNGAGKSTTIRIVVGAMAPDEGSVSVAGLPMEAEAAAARRLVGYLPEESPVQPDLTVEEFVRFRAELWGVPRRARAAAVDRALDRCRVADVRRRLCGQLSKGYRQRAGMAAAIVHGPRVLVLDEPTSGLDPEQEMEFRALLSGLGSECTVLLSSHVLAEVEASCDRAVLIDRGRLVASGTMAELRALGAGAHRVVIEACGSPDRVLAGIAGVDAVASGEQDGAWTPCVLTVAAGHDPSSVAAEAGRALVAAGTPPRAVRIEEPSLEGTFLSIVRRRRGGEG